MTTMLRDGTTVEDRRLDELEHFDERSRNHPVREILTGSRGRQDRNKWWPTGPTLNQNKEGQCVSEACHDRRNGSPLRRRPVIDAFEMRREFYEACQHRDPWAGCINGHDGPAYSGTSVLAGAQEGQARGWWSSYKWIGAGSGTVEDDIIDTLRTVGGIVFGIPWLHGMYTTSPDGLVNVTGPMIGRHAIHGWEWIPRLRLPKSFTGTKPAVAWHNSWGPSYGVTRRGVSGVGFILLDDLLGLMEQRGMGMVPLH